VAPLPSTAHFAPVDRARHDDDAVPPPAVQQMPVQERGVRRARPVPYRLHTQARARRDGTLELEFGNSGRAAAVFQIRSASSLDAPRTYTVEPGKSLSGLWVIAGGFDLEVFGPNGYFRSYTGGASGALLHVDDELDDLRRGELHVTNRDSSPRRVVIADGYSREHVTRVLAPGETFSHRHVPAERSGWYDLSITAEGTPFRAQLAGHVETGEESLTDPAIG
jgi:phospholipase C